MRLLLVFLASIFAATSAIENVASGTTLDSTIADSNWIERGLEQISAERMVADIAELSSPRFGGRQTGTDQDRESAAFVADRFSALRLHRSTASTPENRTNPLPQREWKQTMPVTAATIQDEPFLQIASQQPLDATSRA
jgi:hypothetical protein